MLGQALKLFSHTSKLERLADKAASAASGRGQSPQAQRNWMLLGGALTAVRWLIKLGPPAKKSLYTAKLKPGQTYEITVMDRKKSKS